MNIDFFKSWWNENFYKIKEIEIKPYHLNENFLTFASRFVDSPHTILLASNEQGGDFHFLGLSPWLVLVAKKDHVEIKTDEKTDSFYISPLTILNELININRIDLKPFPFTAGLMGYFSYEFGSHLTSSTVLPSLNTPLAYFTLPSLLFCHKINGNKTYSIVLTYEKKNNSPWESFKIPSLPEFMEGDASNLTSNFTQSRYIKTIHRIKESILDGESYQINLTQQFKSLFSGHPYTIFQKIFKINPTNYFAYINAVDHQVISSSPESFLKCEDSKITAQPIKGTRPCHEHSIDNEKEILELKNSPKERAELSMIVDLFRNDLHQVAYNIKVEDHCKITKYQNVYHLSSTIKGQLNPNKSLIDLISATFPSGSVTGCPKRRSMEIIDELESTNRGVYTGAIGYISFHNSLELSVAIRTAIYTDQTLYLSSGGGITLKSDPLKEYEETIHKVKSFFEVLDLIPFEKNNTRWLWIDGAFQEEGDAKIALLSEGVLYGEGLFETFRADHGKIFFLTDHLERLMYSCQKLDFLIKSRLCLANQFHSETKGFRVVARHDDELAEGANSQPNINWDAVISHLLKLNNLLESLAKVKIGIIRHHKNLYHFFATCEPLFLEQKGLSLLTYPEYPTSYMGQFKTMNYFFYREAKKWAHKNGASEALLLDPFQKIVETSSSNLLLVNEKTLIIPQSQYQLHGIFRKKVVSWFKENHYEIFENEVSINDLKNIKKAILTNSLRGAQPVTSINHQPFVDISDLTIKINKDLHSIPSSLP